MSIVVSLKHGVNPAIPKCFFCGEDKNELVLLGRLPGDVEAPKNAVFNHDPCDKCADYMKQGIILISTKDDDQEYRTGGWAVVKEEAIRRVVESKEMLERTLKSRVAFVADAVWDAWGLPRIVVGTKKEE